MEQTKRRRPVVAFLLSIILPGLGHVYCGKLSHGLIFFFGFWFALSMMGLLGLISSMTGIWTFLGVALLMQLLIAAHAALVSARVREIPLKWYNRWYCYVAGIALFAFVLGPAMVWVFQFKVAGLRTFKIPSTSMEPTLQRGDHIVVKLKPWGDYDPVRGDVVVFLYPMDKSKYFIHRIIGLPGERIEIRNKDIFINDRRLDDPWRVHADKKFIPGRDNCGPVTIPPKAVFVMGDNRDHSFDSRFFGVVETKDVEGKAIFIYYSNDPGRVFKQIK